MPHIMLCYIMLHIMLCYINMYAIGSLEGQLNFDSARKVSHLAIFYYKLHFFLQANILLINIQ